MHHAARYAILLVALLATAGCTAGEPGFGPVEYRDGNLSVTVTTPAPIVHAALQVTVSALDGLQQREVFAEARYVDLSTGTNRFTYAVTLPDGAYRCYIHLYDGQQRRGAVIRELTVAGDRGRG